MFYGGLRCTDLMFDGVVCFYRGFVYYVFYRHFLEGACAFDTTIVLVGGVFCTVGGCDFLLCFFYHL